MSIIAVNHHPSSRQLHQFGFLWLVVFGILGALSWFKSGNHDAGLLLWSTALLVPIAGWIFPSFMRIVFLGLSYAAFPIGFVVSHVILALVYYLVFTSMGLLMRVFRYDPLERSFHLGRESYWTPRAEKVETKQYFHQF